jgi:UDP-N-acetylglucosamine--N-acetylmuramyl-(pentapeptide) pyrophosphoryl-undecaprenol N-acetylglucosamine transferase
VGDVDVRSEPRLLVAAGGTGGHLYPAIAVAERFRALAGGSDVSFVGTERGLESRIVPRAGFPLHMVRARPLRGGSLRQKLSGVSGLALGLVDSFALLRRLQPNVVMGVGAYVSGAITLAAALRGIPTLLLEPNAEPGLANRWLGPFVTEACCAFPETARRFGKKGIVTGNPVRGEIAAVAPLAPQTARKMRVLVFGGSQGSKVLNRAVVGALASLARLGERVELTHQTGPADLESVGESYARHGRSAKVVPYIDEMEVAYESADLVVARAGATTCAELACAGRPALLVPLALAGGHQEQNAEMMARAGAARCLRESELSSETLFRELESLLDHPEEREKMAAAARTLARPDAADRVARRLLALAQSGTAGEAPEVRESGREDRT